MKKDVRVQEVGHILLSGFSFAKNTFFSDKKILMQSLNLSQKQREQAYLFSFLPVLFNNSLI